MEALAMIDALQIDVLAATFAASFIFIFLKAFQQRNVAFDHYVWIIPTSFLMALAEVYVIANIAARGYSIFLVLSIGLGSGIGALLAAILHKRFLGNGRR